MAVRNFDYEKTKSTMATIQEKANNVKDYLAACQSIIDENVGVENRWSGERASKFKERWEKTSADFNNFVEIINQYANKIDDSYKAHKAFDEAG